MGKGANSRLMQNAGTGQNRSGGLFNQSQDIYGQIDPLLMQEATNPQGYAPGDLAAMNTASQQSLGGSVGGITGQANLQAARTRNAGGYQGAIGSGSRSAQRQLSQNALGIQQQNANLKEAQKQQALSSLQQLYGVDTGAALNYLNSSNQALGLENQGSALANQDFWRSVGGIENLMKTGTNAATTALGGGGGSSSNG